MIDLSSSLKMFITAVFVSGFTLTALMACGGDDDAGGLDKNCPEGSQWDEEHRICVESSYGESDGDESDISDGDKGGSGDIGDSCDESNPCLDDLICSEEAFCETCPDELSACDNKCVDTNSDPEHCDSCGKVCDGELICNDGECVCPDRLFGCGNECVDLQTDLENCGTCDKICDEGDTCDFGECTSEYLICMNEYCARELANCGSDCMGLMECMVDCDSDEACWENCLDQYPTTAGQQLGALLQCILDNCEQYSN